MISKTGYNLIVQKWNGAKPILNNNANIINIKLNNKLLFNWVFVLIP